MKRKQTLSAAIYATSKCDRGCMHCMMSSTPNGDDFTPDLAKCLIDFLNQSRINKNQELPLIGITGGGEPLMNPRLPDILRVLISTEEIYPKIGLVTSGALPGTDESRILKDIMDEFGHKLSLDLSFHLYQPSFPERLKHSLGMALRHPSIEYINIKLVLSLNPNQVYKKLEQVFSDLGDWWLHSLTKDGNLYSGKSSLMQKLAIYGELNNGFPYLHAALTSSLYAVNGKWVIVYPQLIEAYGKALNFLQPEDHYQDTCCLVTNQLDNTVTITPNGDILPSSSDYCQALKPWLSLGNIQDLSATEYFFRIKKAKRLVLDLISNLTEGKSMCQLCREQMIMQGLAI